MGVKGHPNPANEPWCRSVTVRMQKDYKNLMDLMGSNNNTTPKRRQTGGGCGNHLMGRLKVVRNYINTYKYIIIIIIIIIIYSSNCLNSGLVHFQCESEPN